MTEDNMFDNLLNEAIYESLLLDDDQFNALMFNLQRTKFKGRGIALLNAFTAFRSFPGHYAYSEEIVFES